MTHPGTLKLRQLHAGESVPDEVKHHATGCAECQALLTSFGAEQREFEAAVPFERFAAAVERSAQRPAPRALWRRATPSLLAAAGAVALVLGAQLYQTASPYGPNHLKGGSGIDVIVASSDGQRTVASEVETLRVGDRVRLGVAAASERYVIAISIDEAGVITPLYVENGRSLAIPASRWLPDSLEFTGSGLERVVVVLSSTPLSLDAVAEATQQAFVSAGRRFDRMPSPPVPGAHAVFQQTFRKP